ncbi:MAG: cytochrome c [Chitinophagaceae bacterium]|nr:MAG: cytochrome c [Chitinophagaceae bacterium]
MKLLYFFMLSFVWLGCNSNEKSGEPAKAVQTSVSPIEEGAHLFKVNCSQCHLPAKDFAAPALAGVEARWKDKNLLYEFVKNSQAVIKKDKYAADLFEKWKQAPMLPFDYLSNAEIDAIFAYCNSVAGQ